MLSVSFGFMGPPTRLWRQRRRRMSVAGTSLAINSSMAGNCDTGSNPAMRSSISLYEDGSRVLCCISRTPVKACFAV